MKIPSPFFFPFALGLICLTLGWITVPRSEAQTWATNSPMQAARWSHTATLLNDGTVLIAGGIIYNTNGVFENTNACEIYNPQTGASTSTAPLQSYRDGHRATLLPDGQVLVSGGGGDSSSEIYDPSTSSWGSLASMSYERKVPVAVLLPSGKVLVAGGYDDNSGQDLSTAELYDPVAGTWSPTGSMPYPADTFAAVLLTNGTVLVCGGSDASQSIYYETNAAIYNPITQTWTNTTPMNEARAGHTATLLQNGQVLVEGGSGDNTAEIYDPGTATWNFVSTMNDGRLYSDAVLLNNGQVMVLGDGNPDVELYDPNADTWTYTDPLPVPGNQQSITLLDGGQVLVTGGSGTEYNGPALNVIETYGSTVMLPQLAVTDSPQNGVPPLTVHFTSPAVDSIGNTVTNWLWTFGDGATSAAQSPSHVYTNTGTYFPSLTAYSTFGSTPLNVSGPGTVTVAIPTLAASASPQSGLAALTVQFSTPAVDSDGFTVTNWSWNFGDGVNSSAQNPSHTYLNAGYYSPSLVAHSAFGSTPVTIAYGFGTITVTNSPNPAFRSLYSFSATTGTSSTNTDGSNPNGGLIILGNTLYGTTQHGGSKSAGTLFAIHSDGSLFTNLCNFSLSTGGIPPAGVVSSGNTLFGTTYLGGTLQGGTIFSISATGGSYSNLLSYNFNNVPNSGYEPQAGVVLTGNYLYGTTWYGGSVDHGTVSFVTTNGSNGGILHSFSNPSGPNDNFNYDGLYPSSKLIFSSGLLYGTAEQGGNYGYGTVFSINTNLPYTLTPLHYFTAPDPITGTNLDGANPFSGLVLSGNTLYGTTDGGGSTGNGTVFAVNTDGTGFTNLYSFKGGSDGSAPRCGLTMVSGTLYGTTSGGGIYTNGTLFSIRANGSGYASLYSFTGGYDGSNPQSDLLLSSNVLYGAAYYGGTTGDGTLFSFVLPTQLNISLAGTNVLLTWAANNVAYTLQSTSKLQTGAVWSAVSPLPVVLNGLNTVTNPVSSAPRFYRLVQ
jgi:uncharacterized repeat protein (TIGR03803 family)